MTSLTSSPEPSLVEEVARSVLASRKYAALDPELVRNIAASELAKGRRRKEAVKATKSQLHQSAAAYHAQSMDYAAWRQRLRQQYAGADRAERRRLVTPMLAAHASTQERLPLLPEFYSQIFAQLPQIHSIVDVACGLNPLTLLWMPLEPSGLAYSAYDVFADQVAFVGDFLSMAGASARAELRDVIARPPADAVDLALILKTIPCLEQMDRDAGSRLLDGLEARHWVVSYPLQSLGGRRKGMAEHYREHFQRLIAKRTAKVVELCFETELVYVVTPQTLP